MSRFTRNTLFIGSLIMGLAVIFGAFGAHALKDQISELQLESYKTGVLYQFIHGMAILIISTLSTKMDEQKLRWAVVFFGLGTLLFSGSIYLLATSSMTGISKAVLGPITPIGGLLFVIGWVTLVIQSLRK
ncbi:MAG: DUF423 domain-containing protein [Saprospiraceae bacterium]|nr:DUF423 domain-containing protein [Saprospiraceae bacterium]